MGAAIKKVADQLSLTLQDSNLKLCLAYLAEKITQGQGVLDALALRESHVRSLQLKQAIRQVKKNR